MKHLFIIGGPMGAGKTAVCRALQTLLPQNAFLDADWCWDMRPFVVCEQTKRMVLDNIRHVLNNFLACELYRNVLFCWVLPTRQVFADVLAGLDLRGVQIHAFYLTASPDALRARLARDVAQGLRTPDVIGRSLAYLAKADGVALQKIDTTHLSPAQTARRIVQLAALDGETKDT